MRFCFFCFLDFCCKWNWESLEDSVTCLWVSLCCTLTSQQSKCDFPYFKKNHIVTLTGYFVKYHLPEILSFNQVLETFLRAHAIAADLLAPHPWCESSVLPYPQSVLLSWDQGTVEAISVQGSHCSSSQFETIWALWHDVLSYWKHSSEDGNTLVINRRATTVLRL